MKQGSAFLPMTAQATTLHHADEIDFKLTALRHITERDAEPGKGGIRCVPVPERFIYLGKDEESE